MPALCYKHCFTLQCAQYLQQQTRYGLYNAKYADGEFVGMKPGVAFGSLHEMSN